MTTIPTPGDTALTPGTRPPAVHGAAGGRPGAKRILAAAGALATYVGAVVAANILTHRYGMVWAAGPWLLTTAGTYAAGVSLWARDAVQETAGRRAVYVAIGIGALLSAVFAGVHLAVASAVSFALAEFLDMAVYTRLRNRDKRNSRRRWVGPVMWSNTAGAIADTFLFLYLAGYPITFSTVLGQLLGKIIWATAAPVLVVVLARKVGRRAVPQPTVGA